MSHPVSYPHHVGGHKYLDVYSVEGEPEGEPEGEMLAFSAYADHVSHIWLSRDSVSALVGQMESWLQGTESAKMSKKVVNNPSNYRKLSEPFASAEDANSSLTAFYEELEDLRKKHHLPDVLVVVGLNVLYEDGEEGRATSILSYGDEFQAQALAAYAYGVKQAEHRETMNKLLADSKRQTK